MNKRSINVLLVDDAHDYVAGVKSWLALWPEFSLVKVASSGEEACEIIAQRRPDLVLMDVAMGGMSGFDATRRIKAMSHPPKVVLCTVHDMFDARQIARSAGADDFIPKAALTAELRPCVQRLFPELAKRSTPPATRPSSTARQSAGQTGWTPTDHLLQRFASEVATTTGPQFFDLLVNYLAACLEFDHVFVAELNPDDRRMARSIAAHPVEHRDRERDITGTPCEPVARGEYLTCLTGARDAFPDDRSLTELDVDGCAGAPLLASTGEVIGVICGFARRPLGHTASVGTVLRIVAGRAAAELERQRTQRAVEQAQKTEVIGRLAGGIAHDFNNILMIILSNADILATRTPEPDRRRVYVEHIRDAVTRGTGLARQLIAFNRQGEFQPTHFDVNALISEMAVLLRRLIGSDISLVSRLAPDAGSIEADRTQIEQVVLNLIINARDAMPQGGELTIETRTLGDLLLLSVSDTGCGMSDEVKTRIFDPLFTTKPEGHGTGLGLATVHGIVSRHGGRIEVQSAEGRGATFAVYLPRKNSRNGHRAA